MRLVLFASSWLRSWLGIPPQPSAGPGGCLWVPLRASPPNLFAGPSRPPSKTRIQATPSHAPPPELLASLQRPALQVCSPSLPSPRPLQPPSPISFSPIHLPNLILHLPPPLVPAPARIPRGLDSSPCSRSLFSSTIVCIHLSPTVFDGPLSLADLHSRPSFFTTVLLFAARSNPVFPPLPPTSSDLNQ